MDANSIEFQQARIKLFLFKSQVRAALYGASKDHISLTHNGGSIGEWIFSKAPTYNGRNGLAEVERTYRSMLSYSQTLIALYNSGKISEARAGLAELERHSEQFLSALTMLENEVNQSHTSSGGSISGHWNIA